MSSPQSDPNIVALQEIRDAIGNLAFQVETQSLLHLIAARRDSFLAQSPEYLEAARRLGFGGDGS